jgi:hypothetical protein
MLPTAIPASDSPVTCPSVAIWLLPEPQSGFESRAPSNLQPLPPRHAVLEFIPAADFHRKAGQPEGEPFAPRIAPAEVRPERVTVLPFVPKQHISMLTGYEKPGNICEPRTGRKRGIQLTAEAGRMDRSGGSLRGILPAPPAFAREPRIETTGWPATAPKPSQPLPSEPWAIVFQAQPGGAAAIRPKQALRELALPSPRPWYSVAMLWASFDGFHFAMPIAEATTEVCLQSPSAMAPWNSYADADLPGRQFLRESSQIPFELQPSLEGARMLLSPVELLEAVVPSLSGLNEPFRGGKSSVEAVPFPQAPLSEMLPLPMEAGTPLPANALPEGLLIWSGSINSYRRRNWGSPRLREGGRVVHTLQLGPSMQVNEPFEMPTI